MNRKLVILAVGLLSGCTMIPDYELPSLPVPETVGNKQTAEEVADQENPVVSETGWKEFFRSEELRNIIETALENNRNLKAAALNVEAARALYRVERSALFPDVSAGTSMTRQRFPEALQGANPFARGQKGIIITQYAANVSTAFELDLFGRIRSLSEAALEDYFASEAARDAVKIALIGEVSNAYLQLLADRELLALSQETLSTQEKSAELIGARYEGGIVSKIDFTRVQTAVENARVNAAQYARFVEQDKNALFLLMGTHDTELLNESAKLEAVEVLDKLPESVPSEVLLQRPDIAQAEHALLSANANIGAARAAFFPTISLTGAYGYGSSELSDLFSDSALGAWNFIPQATVPLFRGGFNFANLEFSKKSREIATVRYEEAIQTAFREVADELTARKTLDDQLNAQTALAAASEQTYDLSYARYKVGLDNFLTVLDAQREQFAAEQALIDLKRQRLANLVNLYRALGGGLKEGAAPEPEAPEEEDCSPEELFWGYDYYQTL